MKIEILKKWNWKINLVKNIIDTLALFKRRLNIWRHKRDSKNSWGRCQVAYRELVNFV